eukprot:GHVR01054707.1.p1 GENE.GHVR01054707.1~~GHVR01054707.1.p1  ORF type:complete len:257 (+),score=54.89 GHVR01054707.1:424-1194(+)
MKISSLLNPMVAKRIEEISIRNIAVSWVNIIEGRVHTLFTNMLGHIGIFHLIFNLMAFRVFYDRIESYISQQDILLSILFISGFSSLLHSIHHIKTGLPAMGLSSVVCGLAAMTASLCPNEIFILLLPIPGLMLSSIQLFDLLFFSNFIAVIFCNKITSRIAWHGHFYGCLAGIIVSEYMCRNQVVGGPWNNLKKLHIKDTLRDWKDTWDDARDSLLKLKLMRDIHGEMDTQRRMEIIKTLQQIEHRKYYRRLKLQ